MLMLYLKRGWQIDVHGGRLRLMVNDLTRMMLMLLLLLHDMHGLVADAVHIGRIHQMIGIHLLLTRIGTVHIHMHHIRMLLLLNILLMLLLMLLLWMHIVDVHLYLLRLHVHLLYLLHRLLLRLLH